MYIFFIIYYYYSIHFHFLFKIYIRYEEWHAKNENVDIHFKKLVESGAVKICPSCHLLIERNKGCDHMTCSRCGCNFCYICGKYNEQNPQERGDCGATCASNVPPDNENEERNEDY